MPAGIEISSFRPEHHGSCRGGSRPVDLAVTIGLVVLVIFLFLRHFWITAIPSVAIPVSLAGTVAVMYLLGYSLDVLSLMALTVSVGFVVDDAIVMVEVVVRHREAGHSALQAALLGVRQIGLTIVSITASLVAALIRCCSCPTSSDVHGRVRDYLGRCDRDIGSRVADPEPALCGRLLADSRYSGAVRAHSAGRGYFNRLLYRYGASLLWVLRHRGSMLIVTLLACGATIALYVLMPKGFIPPQDAGVVVGSTEEAKQSSATERMRHMREVNRLILSDAAVARVGSAITEWAIGSTWI